MNVYEAKLSYCKKGVVNALSLDSPERVVQYLRGCFDDYPEQESFWMIGLNRKSRAKFRCMVTLGTLTGSLVHPREVFKPVIVGSCSAVIVAHNHPSGDPSPSSADIRVTRTLRSAAEILDIDLLDHVIVGDAGISGNPAYYSFADNGLL